MKIKFSFFFAWYDAWIGLFFDQKKRILYICPLPCCVFRFEAVEHRKGEIVLVAVEGKKL